MKKLLALTLALVLCLGLAACGGGTSTDTDTNADTSSDADTNGDATANGETIPCAGVFILRPAVAPTDLLPTLATANGAIQVDRSMATNLPGVFAAGDCTGAPYQIAKAAGEGQVAALSACAYLDDPANQTT
mgnify:FL=1